MHLIIKPEPSVTSQTERGCGSVIFEGNIYDTSVVLTTTYKDITGCDSLIRTVNIIVNESVHDTLTAAICSGDVYSFNGNNYTQEGTYTDLYTGSNGCDSSITLLLTVHSLPVVTIEQLSHEGDICVNDTIRLSADGATAYEWYNGSGQLVGSSTELSILIPMYKNYISLHGTDEHGCSDTTSITIDAEACCELLMPNAFSPNGDGLNEEFGPVTYGNPIDYQFQIFDRWGKRIFVSFKAEDQWDGTIDGKPAPIATYFYKLNGKCISGEPIDMKGDCTLVR